MNEGVLVLHSLVYVFSFPFPVCIIFFSTLLQEYWTVGVTLRCRLSSMHETSTGDMRDAFRQVLKYIRLPGIPNQIHGNRRLGFFMFFIRHFYSRENNSWKDKSSINFCIAVT